MQGRLHLRFAGGGCGQEADGAWLKKLEVLASETLPKTAFGCSALAACMRLTGVCNSPDTIRHFPTRRQCLWHSPLQMAPFGFRSLESPALYCRIIWLAC
jgi:hypothetical protein